MTFEADPLRTLGLAPGATQAEIKAAYRRLAKSFHPDTAGEAAIPRFLAIQAAYETLTGTPVPGSRRAGARPEPWRADPERARAARDGWRARASSAGRARSSRADPRTDAGAGDGAPRSEARPRSGAGPRSRSGRTRRPDRATPGSTTYDFAEGEPFDPEWSGASWYGTSSGTYWTLNPKEYADPRKHGPEYQARGRRREPVDGPPKPGDEVRSDGMAGGGTAAFERPRAWSGPPPPPPSDADWADDVDFAPPAPLRGARVGRLALALIGWPPLGALIAVLLGEASGCSRFAAGCSENVPIAVWLSQLVVVAVLLAIPRLAAISAVGTLVALAAAVPATLLLSVSGGAQEREASIAALTAVLGLAYVVGVGFAAIGGSRRLRP